MHAQDKAQFSTTHGMLSAYRDHYRTPMALHLNLVGKNNGHDNAVDGRRFAEDDANQVL